MCGKNENVSQQVNAAKCASVGALVCGILACLGFLVGGWLAAIGGILAIIASGMLVCCGPTAKGAGKGKHTAALVLYLIGALLCVIGAIVAITTYFAVSESAQVTCASSSYGGNDKASTDACVNLILGLSAILIWPAVVLAVFSAAMSTWGAVSAFSAPPKKSESSLAPH